MRRSNFHKSVWDKARQKVGLPDLHLHDLRHTGGTLSAATGATLKELMARLGHSSVRAAMIYGVSARNRDCPLVTGVNGPLMARICSSDVRERARSGWLGLLGFALADGDGMTRHQPQPHQRLPA